ncbi:hypothetical protein ACFQRK_17180 [Parapedobacter sp. GCM10030251]|uniref:hypothetical protein n=1 Tax=Parapedobacter sp. GCM10030251 TaxID=3273419 RepID=UPI0036245C7C
MENIKNNSQKTPNGHLHDAKRRQHQEAVDLFGAAPTEERGAGRLPTDHVMNESSTGQAA